jgi:hypothetical protein
VFERELLMFLLRTDKASHVRYNCEVSNALRAAIARGMEYFTVLASFRILFISALPGGAGNDRNAYGFDYLQ